MISGAEIEALASKLEASDLINDHERRILAGLFVLAGQAAADNLGDVAGFMPTAVENVAISPSGHSGLPGYLSIGRLGASGLPGAFSWGMSSPGSGGAAKVG